MDLDQLHADAKTSNNLLAQLLGPQLIVSSAPVNCYAALTRNLMAGRGATHDPAETRHHGGRAPGCCNDRSSPRAL